MSGPSKQVIHFFQTFLPQNSEENQKNNKKKAT